MGRGMDIHTKGKMKRLNKRNTILSGGDRNVFQEHVCT